MKEMVFMCAQPSDLHYCWEVEVLINNFRKYGYSDKLQVLVCEFELNDPRRIYYKEKWLKMQETYKEVQFFFYSGMGIKNSMTAYIPVLRPYILKQHFEKYPELKDKAIFYHDSDIVFTKKLDFSKFLEDDTCYISNTSSYISAAYFDSKIKDVKPDKLERFKRLDVLDECCKIVGINRKIAEENEEGVGGAQYLLKNIDAAFWQKVETDSVTIRLHLLAINKIYFESESKGFQSWCADMWAVLWNLWLRKQKTICPEELDFSWATSKVEEWDTKYIFHNAGVSHTKTIQDEEGKEHLLFFKTDPLFKDGSMTPFDIKPLLKNISPQYCSSKYMEEILNIDKPICVTSK